MQEEAINQTYTHANNPQLHYSLLNSHFNHGRLANVAVSMQCLQSEIAPQTHFR